MEEEQLQNRTPLEKKAPDIGEMAVSYTHLTLPTT